MLVFAGEHPPAFVAESLAALGITVAELWFGPSELDVTLDSLVLPADFPGTLGFVDDSTLLPDPLQNPGGRLAGFVDALRTRLPEAGTDTATDTAGRRLLVSRRDARQRRVANEDALYRVLQPLGFEIVTPGELSVREQIATFRAAEIVVGPHGAGLTNLLFARPGTRAVELRSEQMHRPYFRWIADAAGLDYQLVPSPPDPTAPDDMVVDPSEITALLADLTR